MRGRDDRTLGDAFAAGTAAALVSGTPSTVHALVTGEPRPRRLLLAAVPVHLAYGATIGAMLSIQRSRRS